jgi:histidinol-phosphate aminotransferase
MEGLIQPRPEVLAVAPPHHGAFDYAELEQLSLEPENVLDFSVNSNPFGPSPLVYEALRSVPPDRYPDREALALRRALAERLGVSPQEVVVGNGASEVLLLIALAFVRPGDRACVVGPTFGEYARVVELMGGEVHTRCAQPHDRFALSPRAVAEWIEHLRPRFLFLCNPNNPTGQYLSLDDVALLVFADRKRLVVVDEAYLPFVAGGRSALVLKASNVLVVGSMTKAFALAGLRLGYAVGNTAVVEALSRVRPAWNVNSLAQAAGLAALRDEKHVQRSLNRVAQAKERLMHALRMLGLQPCPSDTHFFLLPVGEASRFRRALLRHGILVRDCSSFGLPAYVRIGTRRPEENERLIAAIAAAGGVRGAEA